jgi:hypothetical protein
VSLERVNIIIIKPFLSYKLRCGLVVRIFRSHREGRGSIPRNGTFCKNRKLAPGGCSALVLPLFCPRVDSELGRTVSGCSKEYIGLGLGLFAMGSGKGRGFVGCLRRSSDEEGVLFHSL